MTRALTIAAGTWRAAIPGFVSGLPSAFALTTLAALIAIPFTLTGQRFGPEADNPWLSWLSLLILLVLALVPAFTAQLRRGLSDTGPRGLGLQFGGDEKRLPVALLLTFVLAFTVVGVVTLGYVCVIAALAVASRAAANAPDLAVEAADQAPVITAYFGTAEWIAVWAVGIAVALFSIWFLTRLALAFPETIRQQKVQAMAALAVSRGHLAAVTACGVVFAAIASGIVWALRLIPHADGAAGYIVLFLTAWAGLALVTGLLAAFLAALDRALIAPAA